MRARIPVLVAALMMGLGVHPRAQAAEPVTLHIAWNIPGGDAPFAVLGQPGIARHEGKSYKLEFTHLRGTPPMITALAAGEVDIASLGFSSFPLAIENAKLTDLRIIADVLQDGVNGHYSNKFMVLKDGPIKTIADLKGKVVTSNGAGSAVDIPLRAMLRKHGLEAARDYTLIESAFPNMKAELLSHKVDLITAVPPFSEDPSLTAVAEPLFTQKDVMGPSQLLVMVARAPFLAEHRAAVVDFLEDNLREIRWYSDPAHHEAAIKAITAFTKTPAKIWTSWLFTPHDNYRAPDGKPKLDALARNIAMAHDLGFVPAALDPHRYADLSLVEEAAKRLK
jgi:ABC-type nitrate/sulfonate/bicarbonate transport system substrate-binding protein